MAEPRRGIGSVRRVLAARAIQGSNSIEGIHVSVEDALAAIEGEEREEAGLIPELIGELCADLEGDNESPVLVRGAMAHLNLVMIHPFRHGNGRMSRCLQTLVLSREQILAQELCSIEQYLGRNTDAYDQILADVGRGRWRPEGDALPWVRFCLTAHYVQAVSVLRRIRESERLWLKLQVHGSKRTTTYTAGEDVVIAAARVRGDQQPISADDLFTPTPS